MIKEFQAKIGYCKNPVHLYYPLESLNRLLDTEETYEEMYHTLKYFSEISIPIFKGVKISLEDHRFCIMIPEEGTDYIQKTVPDSKFLAAFLERIAQGPESIDEITEVFCRFSDHVKCVEMVNGEFDYVIYFEDGEPDDFRYCIKFEGKHAVYHRFTPKDYESLES